ncbi:MAG: class II aldolase/adducin family protein [Myxococcales bacterium]|nr:class II aldolase/adducin family protein [Myxococcales bacterium]
MSDLSLPALKRQLVSYSRRLWDRGYVANHDGNLSVRLPARRFLCTPTSFSKGEVGESDLLIVDPDGKRLEGRWKPFGELGLHLTAMRARPDVNVVVHAHPPYSTAFACAGRAIDCAIIAEAVVSLGDRVPLIPYAIPGSATQLETLVTALPWYDVVLLGSHGVLAVGVDLDQAYLRLELVEHLAQIHHHAQALGGARRLPDGDVTRLLQKRKEAGLGPEARGLTGTAPTFS